MDRNAANSSADPDLPGPARGEFYVLEPDLGGGPGHGVVFENLDTLRTPPRLILKPADGGFPPLKEKPLLVFDPKKGHPPQDLEPGLSGYWMVSERLKDVLQSVDPEAFEFVECDYRLADGKPGPRYFLFDVVREIDALDEQASKLRIEVSDDFVDGKFYDLAGGASLKFRKEAVGHAHAFRQKYVGDLVFADRVLVDAIKDAGISVDGKSDGLWFLDAADF